jgi:transposase
MERDQGISKAGNPRARTTSIELAWLWLRYQPQSALACWFRHRTGDLRGRIPAVRQRKQTGVRIILQFLLSRPITMLTAG